MINIIDKIYNYNDRELKKVNKIVDKIESLDFITSKLSDTDLKNKTNEFKQRIRKGESLDSILPEAFSVCREASFRVLGKKHYRVQLIGGVVLHQGRIAEMKTGEGKTLVATCPAYLNALTGKGVHIVTTNEYLASRDCEDMGEVYSFLGLTSGVILHNMTPDERREVYNKDIIYGINSEIGFDYLKDNMVKSKEERVQRELNYVIVDEIDSILIDEARTPLIISGEGKEANEYYVEIDEFVKILKSDVDYEVDDKKKTVTLTDKGIDKLEEYFEIENYADIENIKLRHHLTQSLKANYAMSKDVDYIENEDGEILIIDGFTGRVMDGRRFSDGLHEAIEAKEGVDIQPESKTLATITIQNLFRIYKKLSGMSGTVYSEEEEFREIYNIDVLVIPTNTSIQRIDREDQVYLDISSKYNAVIQEIIISHEKGQPVLVGTSSIQKSEDISALLKRKGIAHNVLNAKSHENEAKMILKAGEKYAVTIATNIAGRGTDIKISDEVRALGGLKIIGTERHDSVRIDNQLRGRAGRQGDVGESIFFVSLEDEMIKNYISDRYKKIITKLEAEDGYIKSRLANKAVSSAQKSIECDNLEGRKKIVGYDNVLDKQRQIIYKQRNIVLDSGHIRDIILNMMKSVIETNINILTVNSDINTKELKKRLLELNILDLNNINCIDEMNNLNQEIVNVAINKYEILEKNYLEYLREEERSILLDNVDKFWIDYLEEIELVRQGINLRSYKQVDPVQIFTVEASELFNVTTYRIKEETIKKILEIKNNSIEIASSSSLNY